jgi:hypothetical protein
MLFENRIRSSGTCTRGPGRTAPLPGQHQQGPRWTHALQWLRKAVAGSTVVRKMILGTDACISAASCVFCQTTARGQLSCLQACMAAPTPADAGYVQVITEVGARRKCWPAGMCPVLLQEMLLSVPIMHTCHLCLRPLNDLIITPDSSSNKRLPWYDKSHVVTLTKR